MAVLELKRAHECRRLQSEPALDSHTVESDRPRSFTGRAAPACEKFDQQPSAHAARLVPRATPGGIVVLFVPDAANDHPTIIDGLPEEAFGLRLEILVSEHQLLLLGIVARQPSRGPPKRSEVRPRPCAALVCGRSASAQTLE